MALHPTCSSTRMGLNDSLRGVAEAVADTVTVPDTWGCCAFAGDRGLLHPELTASATKAQAAELAEGHFDAYASCNRTCELGMTRATGKQYQHILELVDWASAEQSAGKPSTLTVPDLPALPGTCGRCTARWIVILDCHTRCGAVIPDGEQLGASRPWLWELL